MYDISDSTRHTILIVEIYSTLFVYEYYDTTRWVVVFVFSTYVRPMRTYSSMTKWVQLMPRSSARVGKHGGEKYRIRATTLDNINNNNNNDNNTYYSNNNQIVTAWARDGAAIWTRGVCGSRYRSPVNAITTDDSRRENARI